MSQLQNPTPCPDRTKTYLQGLTTQYISQGYKIKSRVGDPLVFVTASVNRIMICFAPPPTADTQIGVYGDDGTFIPLVFNTSTNLVFSIATHYQLPQLSWAVVDKFAGNLVQALGIVKQN